MRVAALSVGLVVALAGVCAASSPAGTPYVTCGSIIVPTGSFEWRPTRVVLGAVAVPPAYIPQAEPTGNGRWPYSSKAGLVVRADTPVVVTIPRRFRQRVAIGWGNVDSGSSLAFEPCPPSSSLGDWNPYAGGFSLKTRAACVPLTFRVGARSAAVRFGVGRRCG